MKKIIAAFSIVFLIIALGAALVYFLLKTQLSEENINRLVTETAMKSGYKLEFEGSKYKIGLFSLTAELDGVKIESEAFLLTCRKVIIVLNPLLALMKKFELSNMILDMPVLTLLKNTPEKPDSPETSQRKFVLTTSLRIQSGEIRYDSLSLKEIDGRIFLDVAEKIRATGNVSFVSGISTVREMGRITVGFNGSYGNVLEIEQMNISSGYFKADCRVSQGETGYFFTVNAKTDSSDFFRRKFVKADSLSFDGEVSLFLMGTYRAGESIDSQILTLADSFDIGFKSFSCRYGSNEFLLDDFSFINRQSDNLVLSTNWTVDSLPLEFIVIADFRKLLNDTLSAKVTSKGLHAGVITSRLKGFEYDIDGRIATISEIKVPISEAKNIDSLIAKSTHSLTVGEAFVTKDTLVFKAKQFNAKLEHGKLSGSVNVDGMGIAGDVFFEGDYLKKRFKANTLSKIDLSSYGKEMKGTGEIEAILDYGIDDKKYSVSMSGWLKGFSHKNLNDIMDVQFSGLTLKNEDSLFIKYVGIQGRYLEGALSEVSSLKKDGKDIFYAKGRFSMLNYDSLFPQKKNDEKAKKEPKPPVIDGKYAGEADLFCDRIIFKSEDIRNAEMKVVVSEGSLYAYPIKANLMKGSVDGDVKYHSSKNGLIEAKVKSKKIDINEFLAKNRFVPFTVGAKVDMESNLSFLQHRVKESVRGDVKIDAKDGWILMPGVISGISKAIKLPLSDTFYFEDMYGEFEIDSQRVKFDDFVMEKNGHTLDYSGRVDFAKNMDIKGKYVIDMRIADTGLLEKLLRAADYASDSIVVDFELKGQYSKPKVEIKYNSVEEYLKNQTSAVVNDMLNELNNLFKF